VIVRPTAVLAILCISALLASEGSALANHQSPRYEFGAVECSIIEQAGVGGVGLATDIPRVYAKNYRHGIRDKQKASFRSALYQYTGGRWALTAVGPLYTALVSDNNYAIAWWDAASGRYLHFPYERDQWILQQNGLWRVAQQIKWYSRSSPSTVVRKTPWTWVEHSPRAPNGGNYCFIP
jgi:hypothetical protein